MSSGNSTFMDTAPREVSIFFARHGNCQHVPGERKRNRTVLKPPEARFTPNQQPPKGRQQHLQITKHLCLYNGNHYRTTISGVPAGSTS